LQPLTVFSSKKMPNAGSENCASKRAHADDDHLTPRRARL